jgi:hypothetical protein
VKEKRYAHERPFDYSTEIYNFQSPTQQEALTALKKRLDDTQLMEFPRHRLRMLSKLSEGAFGTVRRRSS